MELDFKIIVEDVSIGEILISEVEIDLKTKSISL